MSCSQTCMQGQNNFIFSANKANFQEAQRQCRNDGATLANNLNRNDYSKFLSCCRANEQNRFWIGLKNVDADTCRSRLQWVNNRGCANEDPLNVQTQPLNNMCRAVSILPGQRADKRNVPRSFSDECKSNHFYICQRIRSTTTTKRRTTTPPLRSIPTTKPRAATTTQIRRIFTASLATTQRSSINHEHTSTTSNTSSNLGTIVGGVVSCFVLMLAFLLIFYWWKQKYSFSVKSSCFQSKPNTKKICARSVNGRISVNQTTYNVERSSEKHHNGVLNSFVDDSDVHGESTSHNDTQEDYSESNGYREINHQANDMNVYDQVAKYDVEYASSKYDPLPVKREQEDHVDSKYSHTNATISVEVEDTANKRPVVVYATVEKKKNPPMDDVYAVVDKSKPSK